MNLRHDHGTHRPSGDHHHDMSLDDTFDFLNTIELESGSLVDHFTKFEDTPIPAG